MRVVTLKVGTKVNMLGDDSGVSEDMWESCPGPRLTFDPSELLTVDKVSGGFFSPSEYKGFWAPTKSCELQVCVLN